MELSLGFHMMFAAVGMAHAADDADRRGALDAHRRPDALRLAKTWAKATAVLFAIGAVSGTALSFELGLLWPRFMAFAGPLIGPAFALEGYAFFIEAIFLGLYLYGWDRLSPRAHWWCGVAVAVERRRVRDPRALGERLDAAAGRLHAGADRRAGRHRSWPRVRSTRPGRRWPLHSTLSDVPGGRVRGGRDLRVGAVARPRRRAATHRLGLTIAMAVGVVVGDARCRSPATCWPSAPISHQPAKLAAMEGHFETERCAPLRIGGWPDLERRETRYALEIPCGAQLPRRDAASTRRGRSASTDSA